MIMILPNFILTKNYLQQYMVLSWKKEWVLITDANLVFSQIRNGRLNN